MAKIELRDKNGNIKDYAIVDTDRFDELNKYKWYSTKDGYAKSVIGNKNIFMHRFIINAKNGQIIDHINRMKLDNRIANLRVSTFQKNAQNKGKIKGASSSYIGVRYHKGTNKFVAMFVINKVSIYLGGFNKAYDAAFMRDRYVAHKLNHVDLNFPEKKNEYLQLECPKIKTSKKKYTGIRLMPNGKYVATLRVNNVSKYIGTANTITECGDMYDKYVINNGLKNKRLNNPSNYPNYVTTFGKTFDYEKSKYVKIDDEVGTISIAQKDPNKSEIFVKVSKYDFERIKHYTLYVNKLGYVQLTINGETKTLHRYLMNITDPQIYVDHIDSNKLNNIRLTENDSRNNLRLSNAQMNAQNKSKALHTLSKFYGVSKDRTCWSASITMKGVSVFNWTNINEEYCARARDMYVLKYLSDCHYKLNFKWDENELNKWEKIIDIDRNINKITSSKYIGVHANHNKWECIIRFTTKEYGKHQIYFCSNTDYECAIKRDLLILANFQHKANFKLNFDWNNENAILPILHISNRLDIKVKIFQKKLEQKTNYDGIFKAKDIWVAYIMQNNKIVYCGTDADEIKCAKIRDDYLLKYGYEKNPVLNFSKNI